MSSTLDTAPALPRNRSARRRIAPRRAVGLAALLGGVITLIVVASPSGLLARRAEAPHVALETAATFISALVAIIFAGRARRSADRSDTLFAVSLAVFATTTFALILIPKLMLEPGDPFLTYGSFGGRLLAAAGIAVAAFLPAKRLLRPRHTFARLMAIGIGITSLVALDIALLGDSLTGVGAPDVEAVSTLAAPFGVHATYIALAVLYAVAALGFTRRATASAEPLVAWIAIGFTFEACAALNYAVFPSLATDFVYVGDCFRMGAFLALLVGAFGEIETYQRKLTSSAVFEERQRLAKAIHNGLAQEIAVVTAMSRRAVSRTTADSHDTARIADAAQRALEESRRAMEALLRPLDESLHVTLAAEAQRAGLRAEVEVVVDIDPEIDATTEVREQLVRLVGEAVANAARGGGAVTVQIALTPEDALQVLIGGAEATEPEETERITMQERVENLGGIFAIAQGQIQALIP